MGASGPTSTPASHQNSLLWLGGLFGGLAVGCAGMMIAFNFRSKAIKTKVPQAHGALEGTYTNKSDMNVSSLGRPSVAGIWNSPDLNGAGGCAIAEDEGDYQDCEQFQKNVYSQLPALPRNPPPSSGKRGSTVIGGGGGIVSVTHSTLDIPAHMVDKSSSCESIVPSFGHETLTSSQSFYEVDADDARYSRNAWNELEEKYSHATRPDGNENQYSRNTWNEPEEEYSVAARPISTEEDGVYADTNFTRPPTRDCIYSGCGETDKYAATEFDRCDADEGIYAETDGPGGVVSAATDLSRRSSRYQFTGVTAAGEDTALASCRTPSPQVATREYLYSNNVDPDGDEEYLDSNCLGSVTPRLPIRQSISNYSIPFVPESTSDGEEERYAPAPASAAGTPVASSVYELDKPRGMPEKAGNSEEGRYTPVSAAGTPATSNVYELDKPQGMAEKAGNSGENRYAPAPVAPAASNVYEIDNPKGLIANAVAPAAFTVCEVDKPQGVVSNAAAPSCNIYEIEPARGVVAYASAPSSNIYEIEPAQGVVANASAPSSNVYEIETSQGVVANAVASASNIYEIETSQGAVGNAAAPASNVYGLETSQDVGANAAAPSCNLYEIGMPHGMVANAAYGSSENLRSIFPLDEATYATP
ncbi:uncharacterized protein LOC135824784 [Sycon ciliatum]|uniref:uncharacterized protein LOC135824784 n=1 Tax=Sycon ciliatum TaxID=27933 RepID=UPI0031F70CEB